MAYSMPQVEGVDHRWVRVGETSFHVAEAGPQDAPPVLLIHGWPQHWYCWRLVIPRLAERHRVLAMDLRGFGWSDIAWTGFEKESLADDVLGVLDGLEINRVHLAGHDWGAWIGYLLAMREPARIASLLALSVPPPFVRPTPRNLAAAPRMLYQGVVASPAAIRLLRDPGFVSNRIVGKWAHNQAHLTRSERRLYARDLMASTRARAAMLLYRTWLTRELGPVLAGRYRDARITVPTVIMRGARDRILRAALYEGHARHFDDLTLETLADVGHFPPEESPDLVAARALELARRIDLAAEPAVG